MAQDLRGNNQKHYLAVLSLKLILNMWRNQEISSANPRVCVIITFYMQNIQNGLANECEFVMKAVCDFSSLIDSSCLSQ